MLTTSIYASTKGKNREIPFHHIGVLVSCKCGYGSEGSVQQPYIPENILRHYVKYSVIRRRPCAVAGQPRFDQVQGRIQ